MATIVCIRCKEDTGYTTDTAVDDKVRSAIEIPQAESTRLHFCVSCWEELNT